MSDILIITDGTTALNLFNLTAGYSTDGWRQAIAQYKGGGVFTESSLTSGRRMVMRRHDNCMQTIPLKISGSSPDAAVRALRDLAVLLEKAADYWEQNWQDEPVWLEIQDDGETERRYSLVVMGQLADIPDQHSFARVQGSVVFDTVLLTLEHQHWTENAPGTGTAVALSMIQTYDGRTVGNVDSTGTRQATTNDDQAYIANKHNVAQLTDIYHYDASAALGFRWSGNLMDVGLTYDLLPAVPAAGDFIIFGIDAALADDGPFDSLVFDLSADQDDLTMQWEYYSGPGWSTFTFIQDNTDTFGVMAGDPFDTPGRATVHWIPKSDWDNTGNLLAIFGGAAPNITGWWVRCLVTADGGAGVPPTQQNRDVYTVTWGCQEILGDVTAGDLNSLAEWRLGNTSWRTTPSPQGTRTALLGLRSYDRGADFQAFINFGDTQLMTGQTNSVLSGAHSNDPLDITGRRFQYTPAAAATVDVYSILFNEVLTPHFYGKYRVFMRVDQNATVGTVDCRLYYEMGTPAFNYYTSDWVQMNQDGDEYYVFDFGTVDIPGAYVSAVTRWQAIIQVRSAGAPYPTYTFRDLILIPADEWIMEARPNAYTSMTIFNHLALDSISWPKLWLYAQTVVTASGYIDELWSAQSASQSEIIKRGERQRLWVLCRGVALLGQPIISHWIQSFKNDRYLGPRGDV